MATSTQPKQQMSATQRQQPAEQRFLGGYIDPENGTVRLTTDPGKLPELHMETCANSRW